MAELQGQQSYYNFDQLCFLLFFSCFFALYFSQRDVYTILLYYILYMKSYGTNWQFSVYGLINIYVDKSINWKLSVFISWNLCATVGFNHV